MGVEVVAEQRHPGLASGLGIALHPALGGGALRERNALDTSEVDDVVLGCVTPVGEQGAGIARTAVLYSGWDERVAGVTQSRFCASGLESVNLAAQKVRSGWEDLVVAGSVESMSRRPMSTDGGAWPMDLDHRNQYPKPYRWTATAASTLAKVHRANVSLDAVH